MKHKLFPLEVILGDDTHIACQSIYIVDGVIQRSPISGLVKDWKSAYGVKEVRHCELSGYTGAYLGDTVDVGTAG